MYAFYHHFLPIFLVLLQLSVYWRSFGREEEEEDAAHLGQDARKFNFASSTSGAELIDFSPKTGKGFKHLLSDDRDKYALFNCNEKRWVIIGLSEDVQIESIALASYERYSSITKDFQVLAAVSFPQSNWIDLGNYTAEPKLGEQKFTILNPASLHTRFVKLRFFNHNFNEDLCTLSQIKIYGKTIYETIKSGVDNLFAPEESSNDSDNSSVPAVAEEEPEKADSSSLFEPSNASNLDINEGIIKESSIEPVEETTSPSKDRGNEIETSSNDLEKVEAENTSTPSETTKESVEVVVNSTPQDKDLSEDSPSSLETKHHHSDESDTRPFNEADWRLIRDTLVRSNITEFFSQKAIRKMTDFFRNSLNPMGQQLDQSNLDQFLTTIRSEEIQSNGETPPLHTNKETAPEVESPSTLQDKQVAVGVSPANEEKTEDKETSPSNVSKTDSQSLLQVNESNPAQVESDLTVNLTHGEANVLSTEVAETNDTTAEISDQTHLDATTSVTNKSTTVEVSDQAQVESSSLFNQSIDCMTLLKFAEFRKKRLEEEKKDSNGHHHSDDKSNVFNKLFIRIKSIETNEELIGQFFDEVVKCFQQELQTQQKVVDRFTADMMQVQEKILQMDQFMSQQKIQLEEKEKKNIKRHQKWQMFQNTLKKADSADQKTSPHLSLIAFDPEVFEDDSSYEQYFQQLFQNQNTTEVFRSSSTDHRKLKDISSSYQSGLSQYIRQLLSQTFSQFTASPSKEDEDIQESLSVAWSQIYAWSHLHTSDLILSMMIGMGLLVWMVSMLSFLLILWMFLQKRSEKST